MHAKAAPDRILIVCDDVNMQARFEALGNEGAIVTFTSSGTEALRRLEWEWFDLVIADFYMPGVDDEESLQQAKAFRSTTHRMALSAREILDSATVTSQKETYECLTRLSDHDEIK